MERKLMVTLLEIANHPCPHLAPVACELNEGRNQRVFTNHSMKSPKVLLFEKMGQISFLLHVSKDFILRKWKTVKFGEANCQLKNKSYLENSLVVQWLGLDVFHARSGNQDPTSCTLGHGKKKKKTRGITFFSISFTWVCLEFYPISCLRLLFNLGPFTLVVKIHNLHQGMLLKELNDSNTGIWFFIFLIV